MPDLLHTLQGHDLGYLKIIAEHWGIELKAPDVHSALPGLLSAMVQKELAKEVVEALPNDAQNALQALLEKEGKITWSVFSRKFGDVRTMGAAKRDRERPDLSPASPAEILWYRALIGKAFFNLPPEPQEYAYVPDDMLALLEPISLPEPAWCGRPASPAECSHEIPATDRILDTCCTLLAALRMDISPGTEAQLAALPIPIDSLNNLLASAGIIDNENMPVPENTREFLESSRAAALNILASSWMKSTQFNELKMVPDLQSEGEWRNNPLEARKFILDQISRLPQDTWWSLSAFIQAIQDRFPDFQRPAGDYDSWFIKSKKTGEFLRGFSTWDKVDGALIRFILTGPLYWLGFLDLASPAPHKFPTAFRFSKWADALWQGNPPTDMDAENDLIKIRPGGHFILTAHSPRSIRYQIARFCRWDEKKGREYHYLLTPESLQRAQERGLKPAHLISLLKRNADSPIPPYLVNAVERWTKFGNQAEIENAVLLEVTSPEILTELKNSKSGRFIARILTPTVAILHTGGEEKIMKALFEMGYLTEFNFLSKND